MAAQQLPSLRQLFPLWPLAVLVLGLYVASRHRAPPPPPGAGLGPEPCWAEESRRRLAEACITIRTPGDNSTPWCSTPCTFDVSAVVDCSIPVRTVVTTSCEAPPPPPLPQGLGTCASASSLFEGAWVQNTQQVQAPAGGPAQQAAGGRRRLAQAQPEAQPTQQPQAVQPEQAQPQPEQQQTQAQPEQEQQQQAEQQQPQPEQQQQQADQQQAQPEQQQQQVAAQQAAAAELQQAAQAQAQPGATPTTTPAAAADSNSSRPAGGGGGGGHPGERKLWSFQQADPACRPPVLSGLALVRRLRELGVTRVMVAGDSVFRQLFNALVSILRRQEWQVDPAAQASRLGWVGREGRGHGSRGAGSVCVWGGRGERCVAVLVVFLAVQCPRVASPRVREGASTSFA